MILFSVPMAGSISPIPVGPYDPVGKTNPGYICALKPDGTGVLLEELPPTYPNGIAVESDGSIVWVESYTRAIQWISFMTSWRLVAKCAL